MTAPGPATVEDYLDGLAPATRAALEAVIARIQAVLPEAEQVLSYRMPTFQVAGRRVVHVAGWARHVSLYPGPEGDPALDAELAAYRSGSGTLKFPLDRPLPLDTIERAVRALARR